MLKKAQPDVEFVTEQAPPLGKEDTGAIAQALDDAKPDGIFSALFGTGLTKFVRDGTTRGTFKNRWWSTCWPASRNISIRSRMRRRSAGSSPAIPGPRSNAGAHGLRDRLPEALERHPRLGSIVGYDTMKSLAAGIAKAGSTDTEKLITAFRGLEVKAARSVRSPSAPSTSGDVGAYVGKIAVKDGKGTMSDSSMSTARP